MTGMEIFGITPAYAQAIEVSGLSSAGESITLLGLFWQAGPVVKAVMIGLALASVLTWTVLVVKLLELAGASRRARAVRTSD